MISKFYLTVLLEVFTKIFTPRLIIKVETRNVFLRDFSKKPRRGQSSP